MRHLPFTPTAAGVFWLLATVALLATAINYGNNLVFALAFLLLAIWLQAAWACRRNLLGLGWQAAKTQPVFAGELLCIEGRLHETSGHQRQEIALSNDAASGASVAIAADAEANATLTLPSAQRGEMTINTLALVSSFPLGLWRYRRPLPLLTALIYPAAAGKIPLPANSPRPAHRRTASDDFQGIRSYAPGDPPRRINWRVFGRREELVVNRFDGGHGGDALWLDWADCCGENESRLSQLTRWVLEAEHDGREYGLRLPGRALPPSRGRQQRAQCLSALARFNTDVSQPSCE